MNNEECNYAEVTTAPPPSSSAPGEERERREFLTKLFSFMSERGTVINYIPIFDHRELDLYRLYKSVTARGGLASVVESKLWRQITCELGVDQDRTDAGFRLRTHYTKYLYPFEKKFFLGLEDTMSAGEDDGHVSSGSSGGGASSSGSGAITPPLNSAPTPAPAPAPAGAPACDAQMRKQNNGSILNQQLQQQRLAARRKLLRLRRNHHGHCSPLPLHTTFSAPNPTNLIAPSPPLSSTQQAPFSPTGSVVANSPLPVPFSPPLSYSYSSPSPVSRQGDDSAACPVTPLSRLEVSTLIRYKNAFHLKVRPTCSREDLTAAVTEHYASLEIDEADIISSFFNTLHK